MKVILILILSISTVQANTLCYTNGDCQSQLKPASGSQCYLAKTGVDPFGKLTCAVRCITVQLGSYCQFFQDEVYGICKREVIRPVSLFNQTRENCANAVDLYP